MFDFKMVFGGISNNLLKKFLSWWHHIIYTKQYLYQQRLKRYSEMKGNELLDRFVRDAAYYGTII